MHHTISSHLVTSNTPIIVTTPKGRALTDATNFEMVDISSQISTSDKFHGAAEAENGKIVMAPYLAGGVGVFDPTDNSFQLIDISSHSFTGTDKFHGAATSSTGKIVMAPLNAGGVGIFDPTDNSFQLIDISAQVTGTALFCGAAAASNGKIVLSPYNAGGVGVFDTTDNSFQLIDISTQISSTAKFCGAAVALNGKIFMAPVNAGGVGVFDPTDDSFQLIDISAQISGTYKFLGAAAAQNGKIVMAPCNAGGIGVLDPTDDSFQLIDISSQVTGTDKFRGTATTQNGKIVMPPYNAGGVGVFDATDNSFALIDISTQVTGTKKFDGDPVTATNGKIVMPPRNAGGVGVLTGFGSTTTTTVTTMSSTVTTTSTTVTTTSATVTTLTTTSTTVTDTSTTVTFTHTTSTTTSTTASGTSTTKSSTVTTVTTTSTTVTRTDSMTQVLRAVQASEQEALAKVLALTSSAKPVVIDKPNTTTVTVAQRIDVQSAAENGGFAAITVSGNVTDENGGGGMNRVGAAVPVAMIRQLAASGGTGVVLMVSASKSSVAENTLTPGAAAGSTADAPHDDTMPPTEPTLQISFAAPPVSVSIAVNGEIVNIRDLPEPILLTVLSTKKDGFECGFYNETTLEWSSEGMWEHNGGNEALVCASTHLTMFAAIKKTWLGLEMAVTCVPAAFLTAEGISKITRGSHWRLVGALSFCVFALSQAWTCFLCQAYYGRRRCRPDREAVSFSHHFMRGRSARRGGLLAQLQSSCSYITEDVPRMALAPVKTLGLHLAKDSVLQRVAKDLGPTAQELDIMLQWGQAERSR